MTDCMQIATRYHEPLAQHAKRLVHNLFHPHHKAAPPVTYIVAPVSMCVAPELETVTVSTPEVHVPSIAGEDTALVAYTGAGTGVVGYSGGSGWRGGFSQEWPMPALPRHVTPISSPELSSEGLFTAIMLLVGIWAIMSDGRKS